MTVNKFNTPLPVSLTGNGAFFWCLVGLVCLPVFALSESPATLQWKLRQLESGEVEWLGRLPQQEPQSLAVWQAHAIWTSAEDGETTRLLAQTDWIRSTYLPRHDVPLSRLAAPPGDGIIELSLDSRSADGRITARAIVNSFDEVDARTQLSAARDQLQAELAVSQKYGVIRPDSRAALANVELFLKSGLEPSEADVMFLRLLCAREATRLRESRHRPAYWNPLPDPPMDQMGEGQLLELIRADVPPGDLGLIKDLGFNAVAPIGEPGPEFALAARQWNLAVLDPSSGISSEHPALPMPPRQLWLHSRGALEARRQASPSPGEEQLEVLFDPKVSLVGIER